MYKKQSAIIAKKEKEAEDIEGAPRMEGVVVTELSEETSRSSEEPESKRGVTATVSERGHSQHGSEIELTDRQHAGRAL